MNGTSYSWSEIADFLQTEELATQGLTPVVHKQTHTFIRDVREIVSEIPDIVSIQLIGSRSKGYAKETSDADLVVTTYGSRLLESGYQDPLVNRAKFQYKLGSRTEMEFDINDAAECIRALQVVYPSWDITYHGRYTTRLVTFLHRGIYEKPEVVGLRLGAALLLSRASIH